MRILHVCKKYPRALGGDAVVVANLQRQQQAAGHEVAIVTSNCREITGGPQVYKIGLKDTPAGLDEVTLRRMVSLVTLGARMFAILRRWRPQVIHTHSIDMAFFVSFAARFYGIPIVHTFHIVTFYDASQPALRKKTELWLAKRAGLRGATAPNAYDVKRLRAGGLTQTVLLPNGVDAAFWRPDDHAKRAETFTFLSVGRLERQKGYKYLIKAAGRLAAARPGAFRVVIVGDGSQEAALRTRIRELDLEDVVTLVGRKSPEEVRTWLSVADVAVFPSLYETTPVTMLEAWAVGVPVIMTAVGIVRDASDGFSAAQVVPPKDERLLMAAMNRWMVDAKDRLSTAARGHQEVQRYSWPRIVQAAESIYRGVL